MDIRSQNQFLEQAYAGKNEWWRFLIFVLILIGLFILSYLIIDGITLPSNSSEVLDEETFQTAVDWE